MTRSENIAKIREACVKVNPEIMELKFGCVVQRECDCGLVCKSRVRYVQEGIEYGNGKSRGVTIDHMEDSCMGVGVSIMVRDLPSSWNKETWGYEIIGRDIRLSDVLYALHKNYGVSHNMIISCLDSGRFYDNDEGHSYYLKNVWNLLKDRLEDQSDECISFLVDLLN